MADDYYFNRGLSDARRDRGSLFRRVGKEIVPEPDDPMADEWEPWKREEYMAGYETGADEAFYA